MADFCEYDNGNPGSLREELLDRPSNRQLFKKDPVPRHVDDRATLQPGNISIVLPSASHRN
jgi:hypothetical protein